MGAAQPAAREELLQRGADQSERREPAELAAQGQAHEQLGVPVAGPGPHRGDLLVAQPGDYHVLHAKSADGRGDQRREVVGRADVLQVQVGTRPAGQHPQRVFEAEAAGRRSGQLGGGERADGHRPTAAGHVVLVLDDRHAVAGAAHVELNQVAAGVQDGLQRRAGVLPGAVRCEAGAVGGDQWRQAHAAVPQARRAQGQGLGGLGHERIQPRAGWLGDSARI